MMTTLLAVAALASCQKEADTSSIVDGEWHTTVMTLGGESLADVYIQFAGGLFTLYQKTGEMQRYYIYEGTFTLNQDVLSGVYSDGAPWGASYKVSVAGDVLTMVAQNASKETSVYNRTAIPSEIKSQAAPATKADSVSGPVL